MERKFMVLAAPYLLVCLLWAQPSVAQMDAHFSQYFISPMVLNPALTGVMDGDYRGAVIFRSQFGNTLTTRGISGDLTTNENCNLGMDFFNQSSNDGSYAFYSGHFNFAYTGIRWGTTTQNCISLAMQAGFINRRFDVSKLQFGDQWTPGLGYQGQISGEPIANPSVASFDMAVGLLYYKADPAKKYNFFGGLAAFHLSRPGNPFLSANGDRLPVRYSMHAGVRIASAEGVSIVPNILYMREGNAEEKMVGAYVQLYATENVDFMFGGNWRLGDAICPFAGFYYSGMSVGLSYDVAASAATAGITRTGSFELSLSYTGKRKKTMKTKPFNCPRF